MFGGITLVAAYMGISFIDWYIKKNNGKQSIIAFMLVLVLVLALISLPIKKLMMSDDTVPAGGDEAGEPEVSQ